MTEPYQKQCGKCDKSYSFTLNACPFCTAEEKRSPVVHVVTDTLTCGRVVATRHSNEPRWVVHVRAPGPTLLLDEAKKLSEDLTAVLAAVEMKA